MILNIETKKYLSFCLKEEEKYSRAQLMEILETSDATIKNGVFKPNGYNSILLFVTENKTSDRTPYRDRIDNNELRFQGQTKGKTDSIIINHIHNNDEILLFYRTHKTEFPNYGFAYKGIYDYLTYSGDSPKNFVLVRRNPLFFINIPVNENIFSVFPQSPFDYSSDVDARTKCETIIAMRQGQPSFRKALLSLYNSKCQISECSITSVLEAAHILQYRGDHSHHLCNGLLLRADIHTLFDRNQISVDPETMQVIIIDETLRNSEYGKFEGKKIYINDMLLPDVKKVLSIRKKKIISLSET